MAWRVRIPELFGWVAQAEKPAQQTEVVTHDPYHGPKDENARLAMEVTGVAHYAKVECQD